MLRGDDMFKYLREEIQAIKTRDPAARTSLEALVCYPGLHAILVHKLTHKLYEAKFFFLARVISNIARFFTGVEIHPGAKIGRGVFIDHGMGVVIGETAEVGDMATIYQGVTLGGTGKDIGKRHPTIGENVVVSSGAKVLGPFTVGANSKIGAGAVVLKEVPPNCTVVGVPGRIVVKDNKKIDPCKGKFERTSIDLDQIGLPDPVAQEFSCMLKKIQELEESVRVLEQEKER